MCLKYNRMPYGLGQKLIVCLVGSEEEGWGQLSLFFFFFF